MGACDKLGRSALAMEALGLGLFLILFTGCAELKATLALRPQIAVKVPGAESQIPEGRRATTNGWTFVHLAAVSYETRSNSAVVLDQPAQWFLVVPDDAKKVKTSEFGTAIIENMN